MPRSRCRRWSKAVVFIVALLSAQIVLYQALEPDTAHAQAPEPLKMTFMNVSSSGGERAHEQLRSILETNPNVQVYDDADVVPRLDDYALSLKILRKGELRQKYRARIRRMLRAQGLEGLFLIDVYSRGRKMQIVVIGPDGVELLDVERAIKNGKPTDKQAIDVLQDGFGVLGPEVLAFREANPAEEDTQDPPEEPDDATVNKALPSPDEPRLGSLKRRLELGVGVFVGRRQMEVKEGDTPQDFKLQHGSPFVGASVRVDGIATSLSQGQAALSLSFFGSYAQFTTIFFDNDTNAKQELSSSFSRVGAEAGYLRELSAKFLLDGYAGAEVISLTIAKNAFYTGNRYVMARAGAGLGIRLGDETTLRPHVGILPVFTADNSGGAFGASPFSLGYEAGVRLSFSLTESLFVQANYAFQYLAPEFPEPSAIIGVPTSSSDLVHTGNLLIGLSL